MALFVEPECWDYWLMPGETFVVRAPVEASTDNFDLSIFNDGIQIWPSRGMGDVTVWSNDVQLEWSHQRPAGWPDQCDKAS